MEKWVSKMAKAINRVCPANSFFVLRYSSILIRGRTLYNYIGHHVNPIIHPIVPAWSYCASFNRRAYEHGSTGFHVFRMGLHLGQQEGGSGSSSLSLQFSGDQRLRYKH